jgi:DNA topoisomerase-3
MQTCGRSLDTEKYRKILSEVKGIGTPATQAMYPEHLKKYEYITDTNDRYVSTPKGRGLIDTISPSLTSPDLTAEWELKLRLIESGDLSGDEYKKELHYYVHDLIIDAKSKSGKVEINSGKGTQLICPKCSKTIVESVKMYSCVDTSCSFIVYKTISGKTISLSMIKELVNNKVTSLISGFKKKDGSGQYSAKLTLNENCEVKFSFDKSLDVPCPKCAKTLEVFKMGIRCTDRDVCKFVLWDTVAQKKLTQPQMMLIVSGKRTRTIAGFKKRTGDTFSATLFLKDDFTVGME